MSRTILLVEPEPSRRRNLGHAVAGLGYEAVPAVDMDEGRRFAESLGPAVIVARAELDDFTRDETVERLLGANGHRSLVLLGSPGRDDELRDEIRWIPCGEALDDTVVGRLRLVLLAQETGMETDAGLEALVGDLALKPPLDVVRSLARTAFTGRFELEGGQVTFDRGEVVAAAAGSTRGLKAFCRLGRRLDGPFRVVPSSGPPVPREEREIDAPVDALAIRAVEDASAGEPPSPRSQLRVPTGSAGIAEDVTIRQQAILNAARRGLTAGRLFDTLPELDGDLVQEIRELSARGLLVLEEPETRVQVVTDSTSDLPHDLRKRLGIEVVPLEILFGDKTYVDGVDLRPRELYELLEGKTVHPTTRPPSIEGFSRAYRRTLDRRDVVSLHISSRMSETYENAHQAGVENLVAFPETREDGEPVRLEVVDSGQASLGLGILAVFAARMALRGLNAVEIARTCRAIAPRCHTLFVVDTLEYLRRGGRIGRAQARIGRLLRIKPILGVEEGEVVPVDRVRGGRAAHPRMVELLSERLEPDRPVLGGVAHAKAPVWADRLGKLLCERFEVRELLRTEIGPVVGTHAGPGTVGCVVFQPTDEEMELLGRVEER